MTDQVGDTASPRKCSQDHEPKPSYPSLMEAEIRKLKHCLQHWKEIAVPAKRVLFWEQKWHPSALIGGSTVVFMLVWLLDPSLLTVISLFGLSLTLCDFLLVSVGSSVFRPERWTARKEQEFEEFCTSIVLYKARLELSWGRYYRLKTTNRRMYFGVTVASLIVLAWIGCTFNNLFLAYVLVNVLLLLPGMEHNGILRKWSEHIHVFISEGLRQAKTKLPEKTE